MNTFSLTNFAFWMKATIIVLCSSIGLCTIAVRIVNVPPYITLLEHTVTRLDRVEQKVNDIDGRVNRIEGQIQAMQSDNPESPSTVTRGK